MNGIALSLVDAFDLSDVGHLVAIVGGGGKSSLMFALGQVLPGSVVLTTTTRIFAVQMKAAPAVLHANAYLRSDEWRALADWPELSWNLSQHGRCLVVGRVRGEKAEGVPVELPGRLLARPDVDYVVAEADGSRMLPCKAPADHEPVIPLDSNLVVPMAGIDALSGRIADVAHRPERVAALTGLRADERLTPEALARLMIHPAGGLKAIPASARIVPVLNKVESQEQEWLARQTARHILRSERVKQVVLGALATERPVREVQSKVTAVVLAAGESKRMGQTKQLLPWGDTTVLGQTLANLSASLIHELLVVTGHEKRAVAAIAAGQGASTVDNPDYSQGEMLSSLQVAIATLPADRSAVLVMLADQPMVRPETINRLLVAYWQRKGRLVAPYYQGRRGNPVVIDQALFDELLTLPRGAAPRALLKRHPESLCQLDVDDPAVLQDLDNLADYRRWRPS